MAEPKHATLGASSSGRWSKCPGSIRQAHGIVEAPSKYAQVGTAAHEVGETILKGKTERQAITALKKPFKTLLKDQDMEDFWSAVRTYVDWVQAKMEEFPNAEHLFEEQVRLEFIAPKMYGTSDYTMVDLFNTIEVADYKHGKGIVVEMEDNTQAAYYGLGAAHKHGYNFETIKTTIIQPRANHYYGAIRSSEEIPMEDFRLKWTDFFTEAVARVHEANAAPNLDKYLVPGDHCTNYFCPARFTCPAIKAKTQELARVDFDAVGPIEPVDPKTLTPAQIALILDHSKMIDGWLGAVAKHAEDLIQSKVDVPGYKMADKKKYRKWKDEGKTLTWLKRRKDLEPEDYMTEPKAKSTAQILDHLKRTKPSVFKLIEKQMHKVSSGKTLTKVSDPRPEITRQNATDDFDAVEAEVVEIAEDWL